MKKPSDIIMDINEFKKPSKLNAGLYVVATPIGNLKDITIRALGVLSNADAILCEDTRVTHKLLSFYGINGKTLEYSDRSSAHDRQKILALLRDEKALALVSDAGTPLISDPGYKLVKEAREEGHEIFSIPGPSAVSSALSIAGLPTDRFLFEGFLPVKKQARMKNLARLANIEATLVFFESAKRLRQVLVDMTEVLGKSREAAIVREITKMYEEVNFKPLGELKEHYAGIAAPKGEIVILIGSPAAEDMKDRNMDEHLSKALQEMSLKEAVGLVSVALDMPRKEVYARALELKK